MGEIYMILNTITGMMYIGQTKYTAEKRYKEHIHIALHKKNNLRLYNSMRKYGVENFEMTVLETDVPENQLDEKEKYYISKFRTFENGYNNTKGGGGVRGYHHSAETRKKMGRAISASMWKINTPERTEKIKAAQKGRKFTEEHKQHIKESIKDRHGTNNSFYGKHHTEETKKIWTLINTKYDVIQIKDGSIVNIFTSVKEAALFCLENGYTSAKLSSVMYRIYYTCKGNQKVCYGFEWEYKEKCID